MTEKPCNQPLILNKSLSRKTFTDYLGSGFKIRESSSTPTNSVILPQCSSAILIVYLGNVINPSYPTESKSDFQMEDLSDIIKRLDHFKKQHRGAIFIMISPVFGEDELDMITDNITKQFLPSPPPILLAHGDAQAASHIQTISQGTHVTNQRVIKERKDTLLNDAMNLNIFEMFSKTIGLSPQDTSVLMDMYGNLQNLSKATLNQLTLHTPLDAGKAALIHSFFHQKD